MQHANTHVSMVYKQTSKQTKHINKYNTWHSETHAQECARTHACCDFLTNFVFLFLSRTGDWLMQIPMHHWYINKQNILINIIIQSIVKHMHMSVHAHTYVVISWPTFCFSVPQLRRWPVGCVQGRICPPQWKLPARLQVVSLLNLFSFFSMHLQRWQSTK